MEGLLSNTVLDFMGRFDVSIDSKGRMVIPAMFRRELGSEFVITKGPGKYLIIQTRETFTNIIRSIQGSGIDLITKSDANSVKRVLMANSYIGSVDKQGRTNIPGALLKKAHIEKDAVIIGMGDTLEVWSFNEWTSANEIDEAAFEEKLNRLGGQGNPDIFDK
jgi:MraZ protein